MISCFVGSMVQAIIVNFVPLLFITFQNTYNIPLGKITALVTINFFMQLMTDMVAVKYADKIGYRASLIIAHTVAAIGLILLTFLPEIIDPFFGIMISVIIYAVGGGLLEVVVSPVVESCPSENKEKAMSLLHSFYCWGHVGVIVLSTVFFRIAGIDNWRILTLLWSVVPIVNNFVLLKTPIAPLVPSGKQGMTAKELFTNKIFLLMLIMMLCSGASEQAVAQWASAFAEKGLGISKTLGDLAGPMMFAMLMGTARAFYGKYGDRINLDRFMIYSALLCIVSYLVISLVPYPMLSLVGCALCGASVGIMWPGTLSKSASILRNGGTAMFALLALAGDVGCSVGPTIVGTVTELAGGNMKVGVFAAIIFPVVLALCLLRKKNRSK
ncbi:MAG: MFS transporter [Eubacteriales bacterium]|nr:MFS transporter [Eubacteriales bacterium]